MNDEIEGIVLKQSGYKEHDALVTILSKENGKLTLVAKGLLKETSRNRAICMPFSKSLFQMDYEPHKSLFSLKTGEILSSYYRVRENLERLNTASLLCEIVYAIAEANEESTVLYEELDFCLQKLHEKKDAKLVAVYFISRILKEMGLEPNVDECVLCASQSISTISIEEGGFVCSDCAKELRTLSVDLSTLKMFRYVNKAEKENFEALEKAVSVRGCDVKVFVDFLSLHSGLNLDSWRFFMECTS